jgi:predicted peptidase
MVFTVDQCYVSPSIKNDPNPRPTLIFLHGQGERGANLALVQQHGPPHYAATARLTSREVMRVIAPQCPLNVSWSTPEITAGLIELIATLPRQNYVDPSRIYLTGWSMGGYGVCSVLAAMADPMPIAAAAVISGGCPEAVSNPCIARQLARAPIYTAYGQNDARVPAEVSQALVAALKSCNATIEVQIYTDSNDGSPSAHVRACQNAFSQQILYDWLLAYRRP